MNRENNVVLRAKLLPISKKASFIFVFRQVATNFAVEMVI